MSISVKDKVLNIIAEQAMLETSDISLNMSVEDLGLDSLGLVEAIFSRILSLKWDVKLKI